MANNQLAKQRMAELQAQVDAETEWWERKKKGIQTGFMKELDDEKQATEKLPKTDEGAKPAPISRKSNSDDDAVLVEAGGPAAGQEVPSGGTPGGAKKRKGKK